LAVLVATGCRPRALAFGGCRALTTVSLGALEVISARAFQDCAELAPFDVPVGVAALPESAFDGCRVLSRLLRGS